MIRPELAFPHEVYGERVRLSAFRVGDGEVLFRAIDRSRDHLEPWMPWVSDHQTPEDSEVVVRRLLARTLLGEDFSIPIWDLERTEIFGATGVHRFDWQLRRFEIGWWVRADLEGKGIIREAVRLLIDVAFEQLDGRAVFARCDADNLRSRRVALAAGLQPEGTLKCGGLKPDGSVCDLDVFGLSRAEWEAGR